MGDFDYYFERQDSNHNDVIEHTKKTNSKSKKTRRIKNMSKQNIKKYIILGVIALFAIIILCASVKIVPTGYTGVRYTFGQISQTTVEEGFNLKIPFVQSIKLVNNKQQDTVVESQIWGETKEKTPVYAQNIIVTYHIESDKSVWLCTNVSSITNLIDESIVASAIKAAMIELSVTDVTNRTKIEPAIKDFLNASLVEKYGENTVIVEKVVINGMDFEESYNQAIAAKSISQQQYEQQAIENQKAVEKAQADKEVAIKNAEAEAEAKRIKSEAEAQANRTISDSLSDEVLRSKYFEKWNGELPKVVSDGSTIVDMGQ